MGSSVHVVVSALANSGSSASAGPTTAAQGSYSVSNGQITVTVPNMAAASAYQINVTAGTTAQFDPNQLYEISNVNSGLALEDYNHGTIDGSIADQWAYSGSDAHMQWYLVPEGGGYYKIVNGYSGKPLDDYNNSTANGAEVDQWEWSGGSNQLWTITSVSGHYEILNKVSGKALDVYQGSTANGGTVDQWTYSGGNNQLWSITAS
jgi:glucosylceramidase